MKNNLVILFSERFGLSVEENLGRDPLRIALDGHLEDASLVATQVKYLARAASKLPSWHAARCILPPRAFEQSSGEAVASARAARIARSARSAAPTSLGTPPSASATSTARPPLNSGVAIDLTCGLGVDSFCLADWFGRVIALERDPVLADVCRENFRRLGTDNILVVNSLAEDFLASAGPVDLVFADPDRRDSAGRKMVCLEDCSPDLVGLLPLVRRVSPRLVAKLSPLFDIDEVFRIFGPGTHVEVVSLGGECKEIVADVRFDSPARGSVCAISMNPPEPDLIFEANPSESDSAYDDESAFSPHLFRHLVVPDVSLQKARLARRYFRERGVWIDSDNGFGFAAADPGANPAASPSVNAAAAPEKTAALISKVFDIERIEPFDPKELKRRLRSEKIKSIDILRRDFPLSAADIARRLGVREGGRRRIAFTRAANRLWQIYLR